MAGVEPVAAETDNFDATVRLHWTGVFRFILASVRDTDVAGSLTQDCFLRAYRGREGFRGECSLRTWLMQIAVNLVRDYARNRRLQFWRRARAEAVDLEVASRWLPDAGVTPEARASAKQQLAAVWQAAGALPEGQRTVFLLRFVEEMDVLEIAATMGISEGAVKAQLFRAVHFIRERMGRQG